MIVGVPKEIKSDEYRVAMLPVGALELTQAGPHRLDRGRRGAGERHRRRSPTRTSGATIVSDAAEIWAEAELDRQGEGAAAAGVASPSTGPGRLYLLPLRRRRGAHPSDHRQRHHGDRLRDPARRPRRPAALDAR